MCQSTSKKLEGGDIVVADVTILAPGFAGMQFMDLNLNAPVAQATRDKSSTGGPMLMDAPVPKGDGAMSVIKIQVSPLPPPARSPPPRPRPPPPLLLVPAFLLASFRRCQGLGNDDKLVEST